MLRASSANEEGPFKSTNCLSKPNVASPFSLFVTFLMKEMGGKKGNNKEREREKGWESRNRSSFSELADWSGK